MKKKTIVVIAMLISLLATSCSKTEVTTKTTKPTDKPKTTQAAVTKNAKVLDGYTQYQFDATQKYQTIDGFGAAYTWYANQVDYLKDPDKLYDTLFTDAKLTVLRFKNEYEYTDKNIATNAETMLHIYNAAKERAAKYGEDVIVLMSCWSPPKFLKDKGDITGKESLKKDKNGKYMYDAYGKWWADSIKYYEAQGIKINYVSIQNECDFAATYDGCLFDFKENSKNASYADAYLATYHAFKKALGDKAPKMIGPETMTCEPQTLYAYMEPVIKSEPDSIYAIAHHLYLGGENSEDEDTCKPDSFMMNFMRFKGYFNNYKFWQTEYYLGHAIDTATVINNCMTLENANCYIYWSGVWPDRDGKFEAGELLSLEGDNGGSGWNKKADYYAIRHFSQFIRPGYTRIGTKSGTNDLRTSAYISKDGSKMAIVLINRSKDKLPVQLNGKGYTINKSNIYQSVLGETCTSEKGLYQNIGSLDKNNALTLPGMSVTTIDIDGTTK